MLLFISMQSLTLTPDQAIARDLGKFDADAGFGAVSIPAGEDSLSGLGPVLEGVGVEDPFISIAISGMTVGDARANGWEGQWAREPYPDRYRLNSGAWPAAPGEVVLIGSVGGATHVGDEFAAFSGLLPLKVVGLASDAYPSNTPSLLMGPGTWEEADPQINSAFEAASASPVILWSGVDRPTVFGALLPYLKSVASPEQRKTLSASLRDSYFDRDTLRYDHSLGWIQKNPAGYTVPSIILPALAVFVAAGLAGPTLRRRSRSLVLLGIKRRRAAIAVYIPLAMSAGLFGLAGTVLGCLLGLILRPALARVHDDPLAPYPAVGSAVVRIALGVSLGLALLLAGILLATRARRSNQRTERTERRTRWLLSTSDLRHVAAAFSAAATFWWLQKVDTPQDAMWLTGFFSVAVLLVTPELVAGTQRLLPRTQLKSALASRMIDSNRVSFVTAVALLGSLLGVSAGYLVLVTTLVRTANDSASPEVFRGQVLVTDRATPVVPPPKAATDIVSSAIGSSNKGVQLYFSTTPIDRPKVEAAHLDDLPGFILFVDSVSDLEAITAERLSAAEQELLEEGGVIQWRTPGDPAVPHASRITLEQDPATTWPVETRNMLAPNVGWRFGKDAVALRSTAGKLGLPITAGAVLYSGLSDDEVNHVSDRVGSSGIDPGTVLTYEPPDAVVPPTALRLTIVALAAIAIAMTILEARTRVTTLSRYATRLTQLGVRRSWTWQIFGMQEAMLLFAGTILALFVGLVPVYIASLSMDGDYTLVVPWGQVAVLVAAIYLGCVLATVWGLWRLRRAAELMELQVGT